MKLLLGDTVRRRLPELILAAEIIAYSAAFSYFTFQKFRAFHIYAWDFGVYHQAISTTISSGSLFYSTLELPYTQTVFPPGTQFAVHFTPFLFAVLPLYALVPSQTTLLVIKSIAMALGSIPIYILAKDRLGSARFGLIFSSAYLLSPALQGANWYDFQPQAFFPTFILFTLLYFEKRRTWPTIAFLLLALSTIEIAPLLGVLIGVSPAFLNRRRLQELVTKHMWSSLLKSLPAKVILISCAWLVMFYTFSLFLGWQGSFHPSNLRRISLGTSSPLEGLSFDWQAKLLFAVLIFGPTALLSFLDLPRLIPAGFWTSVALLSNYPPYYQLSVHYPVFVIPFVVYSAIFGFGKLRALHPSRAKLLSALLCCTVVASALVASPVSYFNLGNWSGGSPGLPVVTSHEVYLQDLVNLIPNNASILTQNNIFAHLSQRGNAYAIPFSSTFPNPDDFYPTLDSYIRSVSYILIDGATDPLSASLILSVGAVKSDFGVYAEADGALLLLRSYARPPILFVPLQSSYNYASLVIKSGSVIADPSSSSKFVLHRNASDPTGDFWYGPRVFLSSGNYSVNFRLKTVSSSSLGIITIAVSDWPSNVTVSMEGSPTMWYVPQVQVTSFPQGRVASVLVTSQDLSPLDSYQTVSIQFHVERPSGFEFDGLGAQAGTSLYLDAIQLSQVSP
jgi:uncharacterized membrane protein